ncbi:hypothetical protein JHK85_050957 [Glycine max]|nr:hypothetical protein JHK86_050166 [Glycine max]KAG4936038.1 hypothetical protein JHK85_050957 [Glycine max]
MTEEQMITHVTQIHNAQKKKKAEKEEEALVVASMKEKDASVQAKDVDGTIVHGVINDLTNISIMDKTPKASNAAITIEVVHHVQELIVTRDHVQDMIGQAMESFVERQHQENEQFRLFVQNSITTEVSNLIDILMQNLQQA